VPAGETSCPCLDRFAGLKTTCYAANEYGKCLAERTCADACPAATPAAESCNGADDDCDGATDEQDAAGCQDRFADGDSDGWGAGAPACLCATTVQFPVSQGGDCRDDDPEIHPGAAVCGKDGDCDGDLIDVGEECDDGNDVPNDTCKDCKFPCPAGTAYVGTYCWVMQAHWEETRWEACARVGKEATKGEPPYANNEAVFPPSVKWGPEIEKQIADGLGYPLGDGPYNYFSLPRMWCSPPLGKCSAKGPYESFYSNESYKSPDPPWRNVVTCLP
jgi:hypothetical protein